MCQSYVTSVSGFLAYLYVCIFYNVENCDLREDMCCNSILSFCIHSKRGLITRKINKLSSFKTFISVLSAFELYNFYWNYMFMYNASHVIAIWQGMSKSVFMSPCAFDELQWTIPKFEWVIIWLQNEHGISTNQQPPYLHFTQRPLIINSCKLSCHKKISFQQME